MSESHGVSRRRVLVGAAWATPAILIATGSPPAAASPADLPAILLDINGDRAAAGGSETVTPTATLALGASPSGSYMESMRVTMSVPRANASLKSVVVDRTLWTPMPDPADAGFNGNGVSSVIFTYNGPRVSAPSTLQFTFQAQWDNGINANSGQDKLRTVSVELEASTGAGDVTASDTYTYAK